MGKPYECHLHSESKLTTTAIDDKGNAVCMMVNVDTCYEIASSTN